MIRRNVISIGLLLPTAREIFAQITIPDANEARIRAAHALFLRTVQESKWSTLSGQLSEIEFLKGDAAEAHRNYIGAMQMVADAGIKILEENIIEILIERVGKYSTAEVKVASTYAHPLHTSDGHRQTHTRIFIYSGEKWLISSASCPLEKILMALRELQ